MKKPASPFAHTHNSRLSHATDRLIALAPVLLWSIYIFGARVLTICAISAAFCFLFDFLVQNFVFKSRGVARFDPFNAVYGLLSAFMMPVAVPLYVPMISALLVVFAKNLRYPNQRRIFNPYVFSAVVMNLVFRASMTAFTRPLAYFNAFTFVLDERLVANYRVLSPLQYIADGSVYENGLVPQFFGYASGCIGEIAVFALILGAVWLFVKKESDWRGTLACLATLFILAYIFPSDDAETSYYVFSILFSGGVFLLSIHALGDGTTMPMTKTGRIACGIFCGVVTFVGRKALGGFECGYIAVLLINALAPMVERATKPASGRLRSEK